MKQKTTIHFLSVFFYVMALMFSYKVNNAEFPKKSDISNMIVKQKKKE